MRIQEVIDLELIDEDFLPRTNYIPDIDLKDFTNKQKGFIVGYTESLNEDQREPIYDSWFDYYKVCFSRQLNIEGDRTLQPAIIPPKVSHIHPVISVILKNELDMIQLAALSSSLVLDFFIKSTGKDDLYYSTLRSFPLGVSEPYRTALVVRTLILNCLNKYYAPLWERQYKPAFQTNQWTKDDARLRHFNKLSPKWEWAIPLRNAYERRLALVEIDVLTALALGLTLDELLLIYEVQFPVLQQNEVDTWYDQRGAIVFTCNKGLFGIGVERPIWESIRHRTAENGPFNYTITRSELYRGQEFTFYPPFERCDRRDDYRQAWAVFNG